MGGTTSACAENTLGRNRYPVDTGNYLRVRGEYRLAEWRLSSLSELPPRARRIQIFEVGEAHFFGTTSACAENTNKRRGRRRRLWNYLRVRGEYRRG